MKKGVSAIVATVLVVLITVAGVTILWAFVMPMIRDNLGSLDQRVDMQIAVDEGYTSWDSYNQLAEVQVKRGSDDAEIIGLGLAFTLGGDTVFHYVADNLDTNSRKTYRVNLSAYSGDMDVIKLVPVFKGGKVGSFISELTENKIKDSDLSGLTGFVVPNTDPPTESGPGPSCTDDAGCSSVGSFCSGSTPYTCTVGGDTCLDRINGAVCPGSCVAGSCVAGCTDDAGCSSVGSFCDGSTPYTCVVGGDTCLDRTDGVVCAGSCVAGSCVAGCTDDAGCSSVGSFCSGSTPYTCTIGGDTCLDRTDGAVCPGSCVAGSCVSAVPSDYVAYYKFDSGAGDETGSYDGTLNNGAGVVVDAVRGNVLSLDGVNDYVNVGSFTPTGSGSICFWINLDAVTGTFDRIFGGADNYEMRAQGNGGGYDVRSDLFILGLSLDDPNILNFGQWYHVVGTYDSSGNKQIYIDGSLSSASVAANDNPGAVTLSIGTRTGTGDYIGGDLDDFMIYGRVLTSSEISDIYNDQL